MHDISNLESQWKQYKAKQRKPFYVAALVTLVLATTFFVFKPGTLNWSSLKVSLPEFNTETAGNSERNAGNRHNTLVNTGIKRLEANAENVSHEIELTIEQEDTLVDIPILDLSGGQQSTKIHRSKNKKMKLEIIETSSISAYRDVEERFAKSHDIDDAFFLAKSYFNKGNYEKSGYWALETNKLDETHEESLLIFAESKVKLGNKTEGMTILKRYIEKTNSAMARNLLYKIQNNQF